MFQFSLDRVCHQDSFQKDFKNIFSACSSFPYIKVLSFIFTTFSPKILNPNHLQTHDHEFYASKDI